MENRMQQHVQPDMDIGGYKFFFGLGSTCSLLGGHDGMKKNMATKNPTS